MVHGMFGEKTIDDEGEVVVKELFIRTVLHTKLLAC